MILEGVYPAPGLVFVRKVTTEERFAGGAIIVPPKSRDKLSSTQFIVVSCGGYEVCKDDDCERRHTKRHEHRHHLMLNDWVILRNRSWQQTPDPHVFVVRQSDVLAKLEE